MIDNKIESRRSFYSEFKSKGGFDNYKISLIFKERIDRMSKSKSQIVRFLIVMISALALIVPMTNSQKVQAADITSSEVNSISTNVGQAKPGQRVYFTMTFGNSSQVIHTGDTIHVTFPQATDTAAGIQGIPHQISVKYNNPSDPGDPLNGQTIATADISTTGVTITFNSKMNGHILTSGKLTFAGQIAAKAGTNPTKVNDWPNMGNVPTPSIHVSQTIKPSTNPNVGQGGTPNIIAPTGQVKKSGRIANNGNINWQVHGVLGNPGTTTITDTLKDGQTLVPGSIKITYFIQYQDGQWGTDHFRYTEKTYPASEGKITESSDGFTITANQYNIAGALMGVDQSGNQGNVRQVAYTITYQSKLSSTEQNDQWTNSATQTNPDGSSGGSTTATVKNSWQATADGIQPKYGVKLQKVETTNGQMEGLSGATFELTGNGKNLTAVSNAAGVVGFSGLPAGTYTVKETKAPAGYSINNEKINVTIDDQGKTTVTVNGKDITDNARVIDTPLAVSSSSSSSSKKSSSSKVSSSKKSSSIKSSSSKKSSAVSSSKASSKKASIKSSVKSSSKASSKKSSVVSSSKVSSKSVAKNTEKSSSMKNNTIASSKSATKNTEKSSSMKNNTIASSKSVAKNTTKTSSMSSEKNNTTVASSSSVESLSSSNTENTESSSTMNTASESTSKPGKNTETSVKVPSKASTISYVNKSTEKSVPVTVSSTKNTMVESSISSEVRNGSGSASTAYKPTLVSSSMNVPATSWSNKIVNGSSATTVGTTVITYSQSEIPNKAKTNNTMTNANKPVNNVTNNNITNNNHNVNKGGVTVVGNNNNNGNGNGNNNVQGGQTNQGGQGAQGNKSGKGNGHGEGLPQTGEAAASAIVGLGIALIAISGVVVLEKKKN